MAHVFVLFSNEAGAGAAIFGVFTFGLLVLVNMLWAFFRYLLSLWPYTRTLATALIVFWPLFYQCPFTAIVNLFAYRYASDINIVRQKLKWCDVAKPTTAGHPHGKAAQARWNALQSIDKFIRALGRTAYSISTSTRELSLGWKGSKMYSFAADLQHVPRSDALGVNDIITLIDVDYYISLKQFGRMAGRTILMYTVIPTSIAGRSDESYWFINGNGVFEEHVNGGACYKHAVWDYSSDIVVVPSFFSFTTYHSHVVPGDNHRALVALVPICTVWLPLWFVNQLSLLFNNTEFKHTTLARTTNIVSNGDFITSSYQRMNEVWISLRKRTLECEHAVDVPLRVWNAIRYFAVNSKVVGVSGIQRILKDNDVVIDDSAGLTILAEASNFPILTRNPVNFSTDITKLDNEVGGATLAAVPLVEPASMANADAKNIKDGVQTRIIDVRNTVKPEKRVYGYFRELNKLLVPDDVKTLLPNCYDLTMNSMAKNEVQWRRLIHDAGFLLDGEQDTKVRAFVKPEAINGAGQKGKPSRMIFPVAQKLLVNLGRFVQPAKDHLKHTFAFWLVGHTPDVIAGHICKFSKHGNLVETDFAKMDGSVSEFLRDQYEFFLKRLFPQELRRELGGVLRQHRNLKITTPTGDKIDSKTMNPSGSSDTTILNTYINIGTDYIAQREAGFAASEAFARIGPKFGDDGVSISGPDYIAAAALIGMTLTTVEIADGEPVTFLSRVYVDPKGTPTSITDPVRALGRIPVTTNSKPEVGLANKVAGYLITDAKTPLVGDYLRALARVYKLGNANKRLATRDEAFKLELTPHPFEDCFADKAVTVVAQRLDITEGEVLALAKALENAQTVEDLESLTRSEGFCDLQAKVVWLNDKAGTPLK